MEFRSIQDYEGLYEISDTGVVRSLDRYVERHDGVIQFFHGKILSQYTDKLGYKFVALSKDGHPISYAVHRLVAQTFLPNTRNLPEVNHKDFNTGNNSVSNLEWCDRKYNVRYSKNAGRLKKSIEEVERLRANASKAVYCFETNTIYTSRTEASKVLNISEDAIRTSMNKGGKFSNHGNPIPYRFIDADDEEFKIHDVKFDKHQNFFKDGTFCRILNTDDIVSNYKELSNYADISIQHLWSNLDRYHGYIWERRIAVINIGYDRSCRRDDSDRNSFEDIERYAFKTKFRNRKIVCCDQKNFYVSAVDCADILGMPPVSIYEIIDKFGGYSKKYGHQFEFCDVFQLSDDEMSNLIANYYSIRVSSVTSDKLVGDAKC